MYLEINNITQNELDTLQDIFRDRIRVIHSIYTEVCRVEADCTLDLLTDDGTIKEISKETLDKVLNQLAINIADRCENEIFQPLAELAEEVSRDKIDSILNSIN